MGSITIKTEIAHPGICLCWWGPNPQKLEGISIFSPCLPLQQRRSKHTKGHRNKEAPDFNLIARVALGDTLYLYPVIALRAQAPMMKRVGQQWALHALVVSGLNGTCGTSEPRAQ